MLGPAGGGNKENAVPDVRVEPLAALRPECASARRCPVGTHALCSALPANISPVR